MIKAQTTFETCVFIVVLVAATLAMNGYFRRALQHNWRTNTDSFSNEQYDGKSSPDSGVDTIIKSPKLSIKIDGNEMIYSDNIASGGGGNIRLTQMGTYDCEEEDDDDWW
ncbi:MAG: hypothetical protein ABIH18_08195 [Candidatus Omnitrophota bacterium]